MALDIETSNNSGIEHHNLHHKKNIITAVAFGNSREVNVYKTDFPKIEFPFVAHGGKFDCKTLHGKSLLSNLSLYKHDTMLMAAVLTEKIPEYWLVNYENQRRAKNDEIREIYKKCGKKITKDVHRLARGHSLKTLAPYFLGVEPFWETHDHSDEEYVKKDVIYTHMLYEELSRRLRREGSWSFYEEWLMPKNLMVLNGELFGASLDVNLLELERLKTSIKKINVEKSLKEIWGPQINKWVDLKKQSLYLNYKKKCEVALHKSWAKKTNNPGSENKIIERYKRLLEAAEKKETYTFNFGSPEQISWLLKE